MLIPRSLLRRFVLPCCLLLLVAAPSSMIGATLDQPAAPPLTSPDGSLTVEVGLDTTGQARYVVSRGGRIVVQPSRLGLVREDADFSRGLTLTGVSDVENVADDYESLTAKRRLNHYRAQRQVFHFATAGGQQLDVIFQVSADGVAFRYRFPETSETVHRLQSEVTSFHFPLATRTWLQPLATAKSGWSQTNPSYEEYWLPDQPAGTASPTGAGWAFPALFRTDDTTWVLITETGLGRHHAATRLHSLSPNGEYAIAYPDPLETFAPGAAVLPESPLPWLTPWRVLAIGDLATVVESTLGLDVADAPAADLPKPTRPPGKASWSWPLLGDGQTTYDVQRRFIDYAAEMGWRYTLIDALWDTQIGYEKTQELVDYARTKHVEILVWYNSAGDWNTAPQTPRSKLLTAESRRAEFTRLKAMGIAGLKIDFFGGDGQSMIGYYHDLLVDAAQFGFLVNFHGCTLPRGWSRTYPHLMTMEAIRGLEFITFEQANADRAPVHLTMPPFTRNAFDPMDFTPVVLDRINKIERRTSSAFELALSVLYVSGIQHYAEIPEGMAKAPASVREFLKQVPSVWDDTRFLAGVPGEFVVLARRSGARWWLAGINGGDTPQVLTLDLTRLALRADARGALLTDDDATQNLSFREEPVTLAAPTAGGAPTLPLTLQPKGGFVLVLE